MNAAVQFSNVLKRWLATLVGLAMETLLVFCLLLLFVLFSPYELGSSCGFLADSFRSPATEKIFSFRGQIDQNIFDRLECFSTSYTGLGSPTFYISMGGPPRVVVWAGDYLHYFSLHLLESNLRRILGVAFGFSLFRNITFSLVSRRRKTSLVKSGS